jgi:hypothetical protein
MKVKILTAAGQFVDEALLHKGVYICPLPSKIHGIEATIESIEKGYNDNRHLLSGFYNVDKLIKSLKSCQLVEYELHDASKSIVLDIAAIKKYREAKGLTLRNVEELTGLSNAYLSLLERGKIKNPSYKVVQILNELYSK